MDNNRPFKEAVMVKESHKAKGYMFIHLKLLLIREQGCVVMIQLTWT